MLTYDTLVDAYSQGLQGIDKALLVCHGPVAEAADVILVQSQHGKTFADTSSQLQQARQVNLAQQQDWSHIQAACAAAWVAASIQGSYMQCTLVQDSKQQLHDASRAGYWRLYVYQPC